MGSPNLGANQTIFKARIDYGQASGCQNCHDSVRIDYWAKTSVAGRMFVQGNGEATHNGVPTDAAVRAFESSEFQLNPMKQR
jgi:hypothetical protein